MSRKPDDLPPDEHLRAALRHAPDAALQAPHEVSAQILAAAHRAAAEAPPAPAAPKKPWWAFRSPLRLGASGAFATVLLAGVVGLVWRGQQAPGPQTEAAQEAAAPVVAAPVVEPQPAATSSPAADVVPRNAAAPEPPPKPAAPAPVLRQQAAEQALARADALQRDAQATAARLQEATREESRRNADLKVQERARLAKEAKEEVAPPPLRGLAQEAAPAVAAVPAPPAAATPSPPPPAPAPAAVAEARAPAPAAAGRSALTGQLMARPRPAAPWMDALAAGAAVQWKVDGEARAPTSSWLYALAEQTQGRWRATANPQPGSGDSIVQWQRGELLLGRLWLGDERVLWCDAQGRCEEAALDAGVGPVLRKGLAR